MVAIGSDQRYGRGKPPTTCLLSSTAVAASGKKELQADLRCVRTRYRLFTFHGPALRAQRPAAVPTPAPVPARFPSPGPAA